MATISNTPRPGYVWDSTDNVWYPIGVGAHQHTNAADTPAVMPYSTYAAAGKNKIINGDFGVWQRGTTYNSIANFGYAADRTRVSYDGSGTHNITQQTFTPGTAPVAGYEGKYFFRFTQATAGSGASYNRFAFGIEDVQTLAGQTATLSFWAKAGTAQTITTTFSQNFGTGGSSEFETGVGTHTLTTSWVRYSATVSVPSISGKTIGASNQVIVYIKMPLNVAESYDFWGFQLEAGSNATAFQTATGNPQGELAACQRYFYRKTTNSTVGDAPIGMGIATTTTSCNSVPMLVPVTMRSAPTFTLTGTPRAYDASTAPNITSVQYYFATVDGASVSFVTSGLVLGRPVVILAPTSGSATFDFSAEM